MPRFLLEHVHSAPDVDTGVVVRRVEDVPVTGFTVRGFAGSGLVAIAARRSAARTTPSPATRSPATRAHAVRPRPRAGEWW
jgi:hypothetical protein